MTAMRLIRLRGRAPADPATRGGGGRVERGGEDGGEDGAERLLRSVAGHLREGGLIAYPTETVYGFGCALREEPISALFRAKARDPGKPLPLLVTEGVALDGLEWGREARRLARGFWPGALTLVLRDPGGRFPAGVRSASGGVAVRETSQPWARALIRSFGEPLTSTSANARGGKPARSGREAFKVVWGLPERDRFWVLDGGRLPRSPPSTIIDCTDRVPSLLREGAIPAERLRGTLSELA